MTAAKIAGAAVALGAGFLLAPIYLALFLFAAGVGFGFGGAPGLLLVAGEAPHAPGYSERAEFGSRFR